MSSVTVCNSSCYVSLLLSMYNKRADLLLKLLYIGGLLFLLSVWLSLTTTVKKRKEKIGMVRRYMFFVGVHCNLPVISSVL